DFRTAQHFAEVVRRVMSGDKSAGGPPATWRTEALAHHHFRVGTDGPEYVTDGDGVAMVDGAYVNQYITFDGRADTFLLMRDTNQFNLFLGWGGEVSPL